MSTPNRLHDSRPSDGRLLARLVQAGVVMLDDAQRCRFASDDACRLLGAADEASLRDGWDGVCGQLPLAGLAALRATDPPLQCRVDLRTANGTRLLRIEVHAIANEGPATHAMLVRARDRLSRGDRMQLMASEAHANRHVLTGLLHDVKGPLNNFQLTLALMTAAITRMETPAIDAATLARLGRYAGILQNETARLSECLNGMHALAEPGRADRERIDVGMVLRDVMRVLRHEATLREAAFRLDLPAHPVWVFGDAHQIRLALLGFASCALDATPEGGVVTFRIEGDADRDPRVRIDATGAALPENLVAEFFRISCTSESHYPAAIGGRLIVEAHGGEVTIDSADSRTGFTIRLPAAGNGDASAT